MLCLPDDATDTLQHWSSWLREGSRNIQHATEQQQEGQIGAQHSPWRGELAVEEHPHTNSQHARRAHAIVLHEVQTVRDVVMAVVPAQVVHAGGVHGVTLPHSLVPRQPRGIIGIQLNITSGTSKCHLAHTNGVRPGEVINHAAGVSDASVSNEGQQPRNERDGRPAEERNA